MKVTDLTDSKGFQPITLEIKVEDAVDLKYLWLVTNLNYVHLEKAYSNDTGSLEILETVQCSIGHTNKYDLWHILNKHMMRMGLK